MKPSLTQNSFLQKHSLSLTTLGIVALLIALYSRSNPSTHWGSFFGNAIADWSGVLVTVLMTKHLYEKGSAESKRPKKQSAVGNARILIRALPYLNFF